MGIGNLLLIIGRGGGLNEGGCIRGGGYLVIEGLTFGTKSLSSSSSSSRKAATFFIVG